MAIVVPPGTLHGKGAPVRVALRVEKLSKGFRKPWGPMVRALDDVSFQVSEGEVFGLLGLNGAGKTTLIRLFLGLLYPTSGFLWVGGKTAGTLEARQGIGYLPEMPYFSRFASPMELLDYFGALHRIPFAERRKRIDEALESVGLQEKRADPIKGFSKGMLQRVGMAQLLVSNPSVVFLDEPTYGLDVLASRQMRDLILRFKQEGKTVFLNSHQMGEAERVCDRIGILHEGRLKHVGPVQKPLEEFFLTTIGASVW